MSAIYFCLIRFKASVCDLFGTTTKSYVCCVPVGLRQVLCFLFAKTALRQGEKCSTWPQTRQELDRVFEVWSYAGVCKIKVALHAQLAL